jgi:hypothetical protein
MKQDEAALMDEYNSGEAGIRSTAELTRLTQKVVKAVA